MDSMSNEAFRTPEVSRVFLKILAGPGAVADTLEAMHRAHLLEKLIPVFAALRGLMQFNQYHKYTVDEHTLLAVAQGRSACHGARRHRGKFIRRLGGRISCTWRSCCMIWGRGGKRITAKWAR